jgi:hypothetical protein
MLRSTYLAPIVLLAISCIALDSPAQELVAWETFADSRLADNLYCFMRECAPGTEEVDHEFLRGGLQVRFRDFAMWRLDGFDGNWVSPSNSMSVRARLEVSSGAIGLAGVGTDQYFWAANGSRAPGQIDLNAGLFGSHIGSIGNFETGQEWIVQLDVHPDHLEAYSWPVDEPNNIVSVALDQRVDVTPGVPVIFGNVAGEFTFKEASATLGFMGRGGDVNRDFVVDARDIDAIMTTVRVGSNDPRYNFTTDLVVDAEDIQAWVHNAAQSYFGDANLDGVFNSSDLIIVSSAGKYEQDLDAGWAEGDWTGDGRFSTDDMMRAFQDGGYEQGPRMSVQSVPEPTLAALGLGAMAVLTLLRRHLDAPWYWQNRGKP